MNLYPESNNFLFGKGRIFFDTGNGFEFLGDAPGLDITIESENLDHFSSTSGIAVKNKSILKSITRKATATVDNLSQANLALFLVGDLATKSQSAGPVTDEAIASVKQGSYYPLGVSAGDPSGVRSITTVVVTDDVPNPAFTVGTDYTVDETAGLLYIVPGGGIANSTNLLVDYATTTVSWGQISSSSLAAKTGVMKYLAANPSGENNDAYAPSVSIKPTGTLALIGDDWGQVQLEIEILDPATGSALYVDGQPA